MHATVRCAVAVGAALLVSCPALVEAFVTQCTPEQEAAYEPFRYDLDGVGCDESTFKTCTDDCLKMYQVAAQHAPDCGSSLGSFASFTFRDMAQTSVTACERVRANTTNKYFPQAVPDVPKCDYAVYTNFNRNITSTHVDCFTFVGRRAASTCSNECLQIIEHQITNAPFCSYGGHYTLGEKTKRYLVDCLNTRKEDLKNNQVLTMVVTASVTHSNSAVTVVSAGTAAIGLIAVMLSLI